MTNTKEEEKQEEKIDRLSEQWRSEANMLARDFCPPIRPCNTCGHPVVKGYCCTFCGETNP